MLGTTQGIVGTHGRLTRGIGTIGLLQNIVLKAIVLVGWQLAARTSAIFLRSSYREEGAGTSPCGVATTSVARANVGFALDILTTALLRRSKARVVLEIDSLPTDR
jgi:hypothetical protein